MSSIPTKSQRSSFFGKVAHMGSRNSSFQVGEVRAMNTTYTKKSPSDGTEVGYEEAQADLAFAAETGYQPELRRNFSTLALLGIGFGITNSWIGISGSLITGIASGGPMMIVYGIIIVACIALCIAVTLSELASAMPNAGGQYYWTSRLASPKWSPIAAYACGAFSWAGAVFTSASVTITFATVVVGAYYMGQGRTDTPHRWTVFVVYQIVNLILVPFNLWEKPLPWISSASLIISLISFIVVTIVVLARSSGNYQPASFVFVEFTNGTGWSSSGLAFILGLINPAWAFNSLDAATHLSEETLSPETDIPKAIIGTVIIGFVTSFLYVISMFFSIRNLEAILFSTNGAPILDIYKQALGSTGGTMGLCVLLALTAFGCNIASHTWQARLCWAFARDNGLPGSRFWSKVSRTGVPIYAHLMSCFWCAVIGCIYMASTTAYSAFVVACVSFLLISYSIPVIFLLIKGRNNIRHGPFWAGPFGLFCNIVVLCWTVFALVFFSFPPVMPVVPSNMNYVSVVIVGYAVYVFAYWFVRGRRTFKTFEERAKSIPQLTAIVSQQIDGGELSEDAKI